MATRHLNLRPDTPVAESARIVLTSLFKQLRRRLESAAKFSDEDTEHVHRLRVSTRRTTAALDVFREFLSANRLQIVGQQLTRIRTAAATARDLDVLIDSQSKSTRRHRKLVSQLKKDRKHAQHPILDAYKRCEHKNSFRKDCRALIRTLDRIHCDSQPSFAKWTRQKLAIHVSRFFSQQPSDMSDLRQLHRFRIEAKKFRYVLSVLEPALPSKALKKLRPEIRRLQDELGEINDHAVALSRIRELKKKGIAIDKRIAKQEQTKLKASNRKFSAWWTQETANSLQNRFESMFRATK
jgi:CHAD domain-containing protein